MKTLLIAGALALALTIPTTTVYSEESDAETTVEHGETYGGSGEATIVPSAVSDGPLAPGKTSKITLTLKKKEGGSPVTLKDLAVVHMEPIHLLIVDPSLEDYHHIHPKAGDAPGEYVFDFTPRKSGQYDLFCDLHPADTGIQEYALTKMNVPGESEPVNKRSNREFKTPDGFTFKLTLEDPDLVQGQGTMATVTVDGPDGKPFSKLEPVMGAFAHMVGFGEDRKYVAHIHPLGPEIHDMSLRGGPELKFHLNIGRPGYYTIYNQVMIGGKDVFAPFGVEVKPREIPSDAAGLMKMVDDEFAKLENVVNFGTLHRVHGLAFSVRDISAELPSRLENLDDAKSGELDSRLKRVRSLAALMDKYGDSGDAVNTKAMLQRMKAEIDALHKIAGTTASSGGETAKVLGNTKCPISGMAVGSMEAGASLVYNGIRVGLCCMGCEAMFMENPEAALEKARESVPN